MVDFSSLLPAGLPANPALLPTLLDLLPLGVMYYTPVVDVGGTLTDLNLVYLNPAAQRMTQLPAQPGTTYRQQFPTTDTNGAWDFHRRSWLSQEPQQFQFYYDVDGFDSYFRVTAQRLGEGLLTIFTDTRDEQRSDVEKALHRSQLAEKAARAEAEAERRRLTQLLQRLPANIALLRGPQHVYDFVNPEYERLFPGRSPLGRPLREVIPELDGQGYYELFDRVYETGEPYYEPEAEAWADYAGTGEPQCRYYRTAFEPIRDAQGQVAEVLNFAVDVTEQVEARQQVEQLNQQLEAARAAAEAERALLQAMLTQAPVAIALFQGEDVQVAAATTEMAAVWGYPLEQVVGRPLLEGVPELHGQGFDEQLRQVLHTQEPMTGTEAPVQLLRGSQLQTSYYNFVYQPLYDTQGQVLGVIDVAVDVTEQVMARRQVEQLNAELEARVQERTRQLSEQQALLGHILGQVPAAVATLSEPAHNYTFFNAQYQQLAHGRAVYGVSVAEAIPEATAQGFVALLDQVYQTGEPFVANELLVALQQPDGSLTEHYLNFVYQALRDPQGQVNGILVFAVEVTEQVRSRQHNEALQAQLLAAAERQVREQQELYQLFEQAPAGVCLLAGPDLVYKFANPAYQLLLPGRELVGCSMLDVLPELRGTQVETLLRQVYATGETYRAWEQCIPLAHPAGTGELEDRYFTLIYQAQRDAQDRVMGILNLVFEVTEQVRARQTADAAAAELRLLTAHTPAFLFRTDAAGSLIYLNKEFFAWTGLDATQLRTLDEGWATVHPGDLAVQQPSFGAAIEAGQPWQSTPYRFRRADGQYRWMLSRSQPLFGEQGQVLGHSGLTVEVHEQVELQQQLERTNVDLDNFIYTASHDLKAPITNIEGLLLALEHELPAAGRTGDVPLMLTMMQDAVVRFQRTIVHLTDLSRLQKEHNPATTAVALAPVVEAVRLDLTPLLTQTQGQLTVTITADLTVQFAEKNLRSVVYNLLSNAFKYHHPDRRPAVELRSWPADGYTVLEVQDNGLGLDLSQGQQKLFAMFQRLHTHVEGTGVGLYMVKRILENAGGRIEVTSELGQGTTFRVYFPR